VEGFEVVDGEEACITKTSYDNLKVASHPWRE